MKLTIAILYYLMINYVLMINIQAQAPELTVKDIDSNYYKTVTIGKQVWFKENLRTSRYNDGTPIQLSDDATIWSFTTGGACCWYGNDSAANNIPYGKLYNWYAVETGKLCPLGWHVPSDNEWAELSVNLGGNKTAGGKLKEQGFIHWKSPNTGATNESGFTSVPAGYRNSSGLFYYLGYFDYWWSSTEWSSGSGLYWYVYSNSELIYQDKDYKTMGHAVRCIKDK